MIELDYTMLSTFRSCPRRFWWRFKRNLVMAEVENLGAVYGSALHSALSVFYKEGRVNDEGMRVKMMEAFREAFKGFDGRDEYRNSDTAAIIVEEYAKRYDRDYLEPVEGGVEVGIIIPLGCYGQEVAYVGRVDLVAKAASHTLVVDHKTTFKANAGYIVAKPNDQLVGYVIGLEAAGVSVERVMVNCVGTYVKKRVKDGEERVAMWREEVGVTKEDREEWWTSTRRALWEVLRCEEREEWPRHTNQCGSMGGCEYVRLCRLGREEAEEAAKVLCRREEWRAW